MKFKSNAQRKAVMAKLRRRQGQSQNRGVVQNPRQGLTKITIKRKIVQENKMKDWDLFWDKYSHKGLYNRSVNNIEESNPSMNTTTKYYLISNAVEVKKALKKRGVETYPIKESGFFSVFPYTLKMTPQGKKKYLKLIGG